MIGRQSCLGEQLGVIRGGIRFQVFLAISVERDHKTTDHTQSLSLAGGKGMGMQVRM